MLYPNCDRVPECELLNKMNEREFLSKLIAKYTGMKENSAGGKIQPLFGGEY